ncbi:hypothetical protein P7H20_16590 [Paenibacillus larvae]|nr:hypothetical protein [Paenibacillus larvae]MDT2276121.1 hypothetical protein [Paenibacillus larvae]
MDVLGSKSDPTPINYEYDHTLVKLHFVVDEKDVLLSRGIEKGKATYYINDVPSKAKEYEELVKSLFDKDLYYHYTTLPTILLSSGMNRGNCCSDMCQHLQIKKCSWRNNRQKN